MQISLRIAAAVLGAAAFTGCTSVSARTEMKTEAGYQAVFLDTGAVYFGVLQGLGTEYPVLSNVFYVQSVTNRDTEQVSSILVKRGKEWHAPDHMTLNARHIIFVETVTAGSTVAKLIAEAK
jgi:hypothetical protein